MLRACGDDSEIQLYDPQCDYKITDTRILEQYFHRIKIRTKSFFSGTWLPQVLLMRIDDKKFVLNVVNSILQKNSISKK